MQSTFILNKELRSHDLTVLQKLYRSRDFKSKIEGSQSKASKKTCHTFILYGSINALSSSQRIAFRNYLSNATGFCNITVKLSLFSSTVAQSIRSYSSLQKLENLLKGTTYQRLIVVSNKTEHIALIQLLEFLSYVQKLNFAEDISFNFHPTIIIPINFESADILRPMRFKQLQAVVKSDSVKKGQVIHDLLSTIQSAYSTALLLTK